MLKIAIMSIRAVVVMVRVMRGHGLLAIITDDLSSHSQEVAALLLQCCRHTNTQEHNKQALAGFWWLNCCEKRKHVNYNTWNDLDMCVGCSSVCKKSYASTTEHFRTSKWWLWNTFKQRSVCQNTHYWLTSKELLIQNLNNYLYAALFYKL